LGKEPIQLQLLVEPEQSSMVYHCPRFKRCVWCKCWRNHAMANLSFVSVWKLVIMIMKYKLVSKRL